MYYGRFLRNHKEGRTIEGIKCLEKIIVFQLKDPTIVTISLAHYNLFYEYFKIEDIGKALKNGIAATKIYSVNSDLWKIHEEKGKSILPFLNQLKEWLDYENRFEDAREVENLIKEIDAFKEASNLKE